MPLRSPNGWGTSTETLARTGTPSVIRACLAALDGMITARLFPILRTVPTTSTSSTYYVSVVHIYEDVLFAGRCWAMTSSVQRGVSVPVRQLPRPYANLAPSGFACCC